jgi:protein SCO1/2
MKWLRLFAVTALFFGSTAYPQIHAADFKGFSFEQHPGAQVPVDAQLRDESGQPVVLGQMLGNRPAVLVLEYLRCKNLCSLVLSGATAAINNAGLVPGRDLQLIAVSIDPRDTVADSAAARAMYARRLPSAAPNGLHFLTGSPQQVKRIASAVGFPYRFDAASGQFAHPAGFVILTRQGRISRYMLGLDPPAAALRSAIAQAGTGEITPATHPLLLLCFGYDPDPNSVPALVMRLTRTVSLVVLACCALLIFLLSRRRRTA